MAKQEHFFRFSWVNLFVVLCAIASGWITQGPRFMLVTCAVAAAITGVYYLIWRWWRERRHPAGR